MYAVIRPSPSTQFRFTVPGQPPTWNRSYRIRSIKVRDRFGQPVLTDDLKQKRRSGLMKTDEVKSYQEGVTVIARAARPSGFRPEHQVIVGYQFYLARNMDCDNVMKALNDALQLALGINDSRFLPVTIAKQTGVRDPHVTVLVFDADHWYATVSANVPE